MHEGDQSRSYAHSMTAHDVPLFCGLLWDIRKHAGLIVATFEAMLACFIGIITGWLVKVKWFLGRDESRPYELVSASFALRYPSRIGQRFVCVALSFRLRREGVCGPLFRRCPGRDHDGFRGNGRWSRG
jgi:hypothetical protein